LPIHRNPKTRHSRAGGNPDLSGFAQIGRRRVVKNGIETLQRNVGTKDKEIELLRKLTETV
ncbi:TPA: hypothetical protein ACFI83_002249, partial [Neisseria gonorrhoeae]